MKTRTHFTFRARRRAFIPAARSHARSSRPSQEHRTSTSVGSERHCRPTDGLAKKSHGTPLGTQALPSKTQQIAPLRRGFCFHWPTQPFGAYACLGFEIVA